LLHTDFIFHANELISMVMVVW